MLQCKARCNELMLCKVRECRHLEMFFYSARAEAIVCIEAH